MAEDSVSVFAEFSEDDFYRQFLIDNFDVKNVASNAIQEVAIAEQLAKLIAGINLLDKELHDQVSNHYEDLLSKATEIDMLEDALNTLQGRIQTLAAAAERLKGRVTEPYRKVENQTVMLMRLQETCDLLRRISSIFKLTLRLQNQIQGGLREITKAAQSINELVYLTEGVDLSDLEPIKKDQNLIHEARKKVEQDAEQMLEMGMESQNQTQVATALQVFHNLQVLQAKICKVVEQVKSRLKINVNEALDIKGLIINPVSASSRGGPGRAAMPTLGNVGVFRKTLWSNMERLMDQIYVACSQVQHLQKVLAKKRDPVSHVCFLDEFSKNEERNIMVYFWSIVTNILTECFSKTAQESTHIRQAFEVEYPKLLKLYTDLWKRLQHFNSSINVTGPDSLLQQQDSGDSAEIFTETIDAGTYNPEKALRDTLTSFEKSYLSQSLSRLSDSVHKVFSGGNQDPPTQDDIEGIVKIISSEMTVASVDLVLSKNVAKTVGNIVKIFTIKCEDMITEDEEATQVIHPPTSHQHLNATIAYLLLLFESRLTEFLDGPSSPFQESAEIIRASLQSVPVLMSQAIHPLMNSVTEAIEKIILTMHKEDFSKSGQESDSNTPEPPCSLYMKELQSFIFRVKGQYFSILPVCDLVQKNIQQVACRAIDFFVRHASLVRPLGDGGKMRLAADFAQMEMAVETLCPRIGELGKSYKLLRSFRPLLFQTPAHIIKSSIVGDILPFPITLHFLFSKAPPEFKSPYEVSGWSIADYSKWLDDHSSEKDQLLFIRWTLEAYVNTVKQRQGREFCSIYPIMLELLHLGLQKLEIR